jgi:cell division protein FtsW (lipid II flippase)
MNAVTAPADERVRKDNRRRSNAELRYLVLALLAILVAYALVGIAQTNAIPAGLIGYGGAMGLLGLTAHLAARRLAPGADPVLVPVAFLLNGVGLVMAQRISFGEQAADVGDLAASQTLWTVVGIGAFCATLVLINDPVVLDRYRYMIGIGAIALLLLPLVPGLGQEINGAQIWLRIGPMSFQPGEIAKLALVAFFASYLAEKRPLLTVATNRLGPLHVPAARAFAPIALAWGVSLVVLVFQRDLGLSLLVFGLFVSMLYVSTGRLTYAAAGGLLFAGGAFAAWTLFGHVQTRITTWLDPWADPTGGAYQLVQSLFALAAGGIGGVGLGEGRAADIIPEVENDFIFAALAEELGLLGSTALILLFAVVVGRGFGIALRARDDFSTLFATGLTVTFGLQVFVILGGVTRLIPLTGLTLPFISAGGSSLVANYVLVALLLRISSASRS